MRVTAMSKNQITEGVIWKQLLFFFFPILLGTLFQQLYNTAVLLRDSPGQCAYTEAGSSQGAAGIPMVGGRTGIRVIGWERFRNSGEIFKVQEKGRMEQR